MNGLADWTENFTIKCNTTLGKFCEILSPIGETVHPKDPRVQNPLWGSGNPEILISTKGPSAKKKKEQGRWRTKNGGGGNERKKEGKKEKERMH